MLLCFLLQPGTVLWLRMPSNNSMQSSGKWYTVRVQSGRVVTSKGARDFLVKFEGVYTRSEASAMRASELLIDVEDRPALRTHSPSDSYSDASASVPPHELPSFRGNERGTDAIASPEDLNVEVAIRDSDLHIPESLQSGETAEEDAEEYYVQELVGMQVLSKETSVCVGYVSDVVSTGGAGDLLLVQPRNGSTNDAVYVPFVRAIVTDVDEENGILYIDPPEGLLLINQGSGRKSKRKGKKQIRQKARGRSGDSSAHVNKHTPVE